MKLVQKMVTYCCVRGCNNNSNERNKNSHAFTTFHVFPSNPDLRLRWLKSIGRPSWEPPSHARICSAHFSNDHINRDQQRTRLTDDACPSIDLPEKFYLEAEHIKVCRICLVTDVKMHNINEEPLKICVKAIVGLNKDIEGLPQFVCFECSAQVLKCYTFIEKSTIAKSTLLGIFTKNGEISKDQLRNINRAKLNLSSSLTVNKIVPKTILELHYDDDLNQYTHTSRFQENVCKIEPITPPKEIIIPERRKTRSKSKHNVSTELNTCATEDNKIDINLDLNDDYKLDESCLQDRNIVNYVNVNSVVKDDPGSESDVSDNCGDDPDYDADEVDIKNDVHEDLDNDEDSEKLDIDLEKVPKKVKKKSAGNKNPDGLTPIEVEMQEYFRIVILSLEEQVEDRLKMKESEAYRDALYRCEVCFKTYMHPNAFKMHVANHDESRGDVECPACKLRFKNDTLMKSHASRTHGKKFYCKSCTKVFNNVRAAQKHQRRHDGFLYKCPHCDFATAHDSAYGLHVRAQHPARHVCARCGHTFVSERGLKLHSVRAHREQPPQEIDHSDMFCCKECDLRFTSEGAWRVHMLTSAQHKKKNETDDASLKSALKTTCSRCGEQFPSVRALTAHKREWHENRSNSKPRSGWSMPGDSYPATCEHCGETVHNRREHYLHVRKVHPRERDKYQPVITAVCETCGKGFQNSTKLHLHELRHFGLGTVRCPHCPRLFYDKYQLARHVSSHSDARPFACTQCEKAFKLRSNLDRHAKVHIAELQYECTMCGKRFRYSSSRNLHVRTVHLKMPHPPRKKRPSKVPKSVHYGTTVEAAM